MQYVDEFRDPAAVRACAAAIGRRVTRPWTIMEICGGQTHAIVRFGLDALLPPSLTLVHGPGCPVCVTPVGLIDKAIALARLPEVTVCSFGDMLRVPGSAGDLQTARAQGGDVRIVYSPLDAVALARRNPARQVVFFAVGFETTAPAHAMAVRLARAERLQNFSLLVSIVLVPPAIDAILSEPESRVQGFLAAGHVCTVMGESEYAALARRHRVPIVITGFEPVDLLGGVLACVGQLEDGRAEVANAYSRVVRPEGNPQARALITEVFQVITREWRGVGTLPASGLGLAPAFADFDAERRFAVNVPQVEDASACISGQILQGRRKPPECPAFGKACTPEHPLGATMVSAEGACAAYFRYRGAPDIGARPAAGESSNA